MQATKETVREIVEFLENSGKKAEAALVDSLYRELNIRRCTDSDFKILKHRVQ